MPHLPDATATAEKPHWLLATVVNLASFGVFALMLFGGVLGIS